jgi:hypothetical protein
MKDTQGKQDGRASEGPAARESHESSAKENTSSSEQQSTSGKQKAGAQSQSDAKPSNGYASYFSQRTKVLWDNEYFKKLTGSVHDTKKSIIDDNASRYGGITSRKVRQQIRESKNGDATATGAETPAARSVAEDPKYATVIAVVT